MPFFEKWRASLVCLCVMASSGHSGPQIPLNLHLPVRSGWAPEHPQVSARCDTSLKDGEATVTPLKGRSSPSVGIRRVSFFLSFCLSFFLGSKDASSSASTVTHGAQIVGLQITTDETGKITLQKAPDGSSKLLKDQHSDGKKSFLLAFQKASPRTASSEDQPTDASPPPPTDTPVDASTSSLSLFFFFFFFFFIFCTAKRPPLRKASLSLPVPTLIYGERNCRQFPSKGHIRWARVHDVKGDVASNTSAANVGQKRTHLGRGTLGRNVSLFATDRQTDRQTDREREREEEERTRGKRVKKKRIDGTELVCFGKGVREG